MKTKRKKPGPKPYYGETIRTCSISLTSSQSERLRQIGDKNLSKGIRIVLQAYEEGREA